MNTTATKQESIVLAAQLSYEQLIGSPELREFVESVEAQAAETADQEAIAQYGERAKAIAARLLEEMKDLAPEERERELLVRRDLLAQLYHAKLGRAKLLREAVARAEQLARSEERAANAIRWSVEAYMLTRGISKVAGLSSTFKIVNQPDKVIVYDQSQVPEEFFDTPEPEKALNRDRIAEALADGKEVPGASLEKNRTRLDIK